MSLGITFGAGQRVSASDLNAMVTQIDSLTAPGWTSYTPSPSSTNGGTAPSVGNGTIVGKYRRAANADLIIVQGIWTFGSTSSFGTGILGISLPVNASAAAVARLVTGSAQLLDSGSVRRSGNCFIATAGVITFIGNAGDVTQTWQTWNTGDALTWNIAYDPA